MKQYYILFIYLTKELTETPVQILGQGSLPAMTADNNGDGRHILNMINNTFFSGARHMHDRYCTVSGLKPAVFLQKCELRRGWGCEA